MEQDKGLDWMMRRVYATPNQDRHPPPSDGKVTTISNAVWEAIQGDASRFVAWALDGDDLWLMRGDCSTIWLPLEWLRESDRFARAHIPAKPSVAILVRGSVLLVGARNFSASVVLKLHQVKTAETAETAETADVRARKERAVEKGRAQLEAVLDRARGLPQGPVDPWQAQEDERRWKRMDEWPREEMVDLMKAQAEKIRECETQLELTKLTIGAQGATIRHLQDKLASHREEKAPISHDVTCPTCRRFFCAVSCRPGSEIKVHCPGCIAEGRV